MRVFGALSIKYSRRKDHEKFIAIQIEASNNNRELNLFHDFISECQIEKEFLRRKEFLINCIEIIPPRLIVTVQLESFVFLPFLAQQSITIRK